MVYKLSAPMKFWFGFFLLLLLCACSEQKKQQTVDIPISTMEQEAVKQDTLVDASYTFEEAIAGTKAPSDIIHQLELFDVIYLSTDGKIHRGQILSNRKIAAVANIFPGDFSLP